MDIALKIQEFLLKFNHEIYTFQTLKQGKAGKVFCVSKNNLSKGVQNLIELNNLGHDVFFMVNEGDGITHPPHTTPRSKKSVRVLTALFIDIDGGISLNEAATYLKSIQLKPHHIVMTSKNKYHLYFFLETLEKETSQNFSNHLQSWSLIQDKLSYLGFDKRVADSAMVDYSRVLRVPFLNHLKDAKNPHLAKIISSSDHNKYDLDGVIKILHLDLNDGSASANSKSYLEKTPYQLPTSEVTEGERHHQMSSFLGFLLQKGLSSEIALLAFDSFARSYFKDYKLFIKGGSRHKEVIDFISYKLRDIEFQKNQELENQKTELLNRPEKGTTSFELSKEFYKNIPGLVGELTRKLNESALYPIPCVNFALAVSLIATLKHKSIKSIDGIPPCNYFLCLAPTGAGKSYPQEVLRHALNKLNKNSYLESKVRSDRGILAWLKRNGSHGFFMSDEAEELLLSLNKDHTAQHIRNFKTLLLELYSAHAMQNLSFGEITSKKEEAIILDNCHFNCTLIGTHSILNTFNKQSITSGLFQRFNVLYTDNKRILNPNAIQSKDCIDKLLLNKLKDVSNYSMLMLENTDAGKPQFLDYTQESKEFREHIRNEFDMLYNQELEAESGLEGIYTRATEKVLRLSVAVSDRIITLNDLKFSYEFVKKNVSSMLSIARESYNQTQVSKELSELSNFILKNSDNAGICLYSKIARYHKVRDARALRDTLSLGVETGILQRIEIQKEGKGRKGVGYVVRQIV